MSKGQSTRCRDTKEFWFGRVMPRVLWEQKGKKRPTERWLLEELIKNFLAQNSGINTLNKRKRGCQYREVCRSLKNSLAGKAGPLVVQGRWANGGGQVQITRGLCPSQASNSNFPRSTAGVTECFLFLSSLGQCTGKEMMLMRCRLRVGSLQGLVSVRERPPLETTLTDSCQRLQRLPNACCQRCSTHHYSSHSKRPSLQGLRKLSPRSFCETGEVLNQEIIWVHKAGMCLKSWRKDRRKLYLGGRAS